MLKSLNLDLVYLLPDWGCKLDTIVYQKKSLSKKFLAHATQGGLSRGEHTINDQILIESDKHNQTHVEKIQERHFLETQKYNAKNHTGLGWGGHWDIGRLGLGYRGG